MYEGLVKDLRHLAKVYSICENENTKEYNLAVKAADAIEEIQKDLEQSKNFEAFWQQEAEETLRRYQVSIANKPQWIKFTKRPLEPDEQEEHPEWCYILDCETPDDMEEILVSNGRYVWTDTFCDEGDSCYLDGGTDLDELWWMPLPKPPEEET